MTGAIKIQALVISVPALCMKMKRQNIKNSKTLYFFYSRWIWSDMGLVTHIDHEFCCCVSAIAGGAMTLDEIGDK